MSAVGVKREELLRELRALERDLRRTSNPTGLHGEYLRKAIAEKRSEIVAVRSQPSWRLANLDGFASAIEELGNELDDVRVGIRNGYLSEAEALASLRRTISELGVDRHLDHVRTRPPEAS